MLKRYKEYKAKKKAQKKAERDAYWEAWEQANPREAYLVDKDIRKIERQVEQEIGQM